jgi:hypothetical protein
MSQLIDPAITFTSHYSFTIKERIIGRVSTGYEKLF